MSVAITRYAPGERSSVVLVVVSRLAQLAELALIALRTITPFDPSRRRSRRSPGGRLETDLVQESGSGRGIRASDLDSGDVGQHGHKVLGT